MVLEQLVIVRYSFHSKGQINFKWFKSVNIKSKGRGKGEGRGGQGREGKERKKEIKRKIKLQKNHKIIYNYLIFKTKRTILKGNQHNINRAWFIWNLNLEYIYI